MGAEQGAVPCDEGTHPSSPISEVSSQNCLICQICILSQTVTPNMPILYFLYVTFGNTCLRIHPHLLVGCLFGYLAQASVRGSSCLKRVGLAPPSVRGGCLK